MFVGLAPSRLSDYDVLLNGRKISLTASRTGEI